MKKIEYGNIPEWALYELEYGIDTNRELDDGDRAVLREFIESHFPNGYLMEVLWNEYIEFDSFPAFGKPCGTYSVNFWVDN